MYKAAFLTSFYSDRVHDMEVYDATAASRYDVTDVVLREEVVGGEGADDRLAEPIRKDFLSPLSVANEHPPLNMAGEPTYPDELERAILTT
ncbi:hypothetical protein SNOG_15999 [Parastagonospora nodorum SN15]|uniref:Uncharacterized protein n=1 Tax=Phaeosphaeria nodorum (strain SN15 / ATCC MYA-4574 / FGSC 10173) TaxID=321614 RepID=Q0TWS9_PHANO|nr:hypothetical protein SNOG_15999 [Parastagonospora nodorum SN15]EAT76578.1 hypothetical protein SNOG_15999 [Parastagonospora nodorum SN15]